MANADLASGIIRAFARNTVPLTKEPGSAGVANATASIDDTLTLSGVTKPFDATLRGDLTGTITGPGIGLFCIVGACFDLLQEGALVMPFAQTFPVTPEDPRIVFEIFLQVIAPITFAASSIDFTARVTSLELPAEVTFTSASGVFLETPPTEPERVHSHRGTSAGSRRDRP